MTTAYLSGPMTGLPAYNFAAFEDAATRLRAEGYVVRSPHEHIDATGGTELYSIREALEWDIAAVLAADVVILLPGWEDSPGCAVEVLVAETEGIPTVLLADALPSV